MTSCSLATAAAPRPGHYRDVRLGIVGVSPAAGSSFRPARARRTTDRSCTLLGLPIGRDERIAASASASPRKRSSHNDGSSPRAVARGEDRAPRAGRCREAAHRVEQAQPLAFGRIAAVPTPARPSSRRSRAPRGRASQHRGSPEARPVWWRATFPSSDPWRRGLAERSGRAHSSAVSCRCPAHRDEHKQAAAGRRSSSADARSASCWTAAGPLENRLTSGRCAPIIAQVGRTPRAVGGVPTTAPPSLLPSIHADRLLGAAMTGPPLSATTASRWSGDRHIRTRRSGTSRGCWLLDRRGDAEGPAARRAGMQPKTARAAPRISSSPTSALLGAERPQGSQRDARLVETRERETYGRCLRIGGGAQVARRKPRRCSSSSVAAAGDEPRPRISPRSVRSLRPWRDGHRLGPQGRTGHAERHSVARLRWPQNESDGPNLSTHLQNKSAWPLAQGP